MCSTKSLVHAQLTFGSGCQTRQLGPNRPHHNAHRGLWQHKMNRHAKQPDAGRSVNLQLSITCMPYTVVQSTFHPLSSAEMKHEGCMRHICISALDRTTISTKANVMKKSIAMRLGAQTVICATNLPDQAITAGQGSMRHETDRQRVCRLPALQCATPGLCTISISIMPLAPNFDTDARSMIS